MKTDPALEKLMTVLSSAVKTYDREMGAPISSDCGCPLCEFVRATRNVVNEYFKEEHAQSSEEGSPRESNKEGVG